MKEQEGIAEEEAVPKAISSSSPDDAVMSSPPSLADDFRQFQDLGKMITDTLHILLEKVKDAHHELITYSMLQQNCSAS